MRRNTFAKRTIRKSQTISIFGVGHFICLKINGANLVIKTH